MSEKIAHLIARATALLGGTAARAKQLSEMQTALQELQPEDFEAQAKLSALGSQSGWEEQEICSQSSFHISLFLIRRGQVLPFHDHPGMTVWLRVLSGSLRIQAADWAEEYPGRGLARLAYDRVVEPADEVLILRPKQGNLHCIEALEDAAFLDLFSPYYAEDRPCSIFRREANITLGKEEFLVLVEDPELDCS
jgi:cysteamine dioxygenase